MKGGEKQLLQLFYALHSVRSFLSLKRFCNQKIEIQP
jgi:hypothetical protein